LNNAVTESEIVKGSVSDLAKFDNQRQWILDQINQGKLDGATLLYAGKSAARGQGMHPTALAEVVEQLRTTQSSTQNQPTGLSQFTNHSGGAAGSDIQWDVIGKEFGMTNNKHYYTGVKGPGNAPLGNEDITDQPIAVEGASKVAQAAKQMWGYKYTTMKDQRLIRNWAQVANSDAVFAIGTLGKEGDIWKGDEKSAEPRRLLKFAVQGGTGYAVEMAIQAGKPVYVFDQVRDQWYKNIDGEWSKSEIPVLTENFAGIGTREINEAGKQAIKDVYEKTLNQTAQSVNQNDNVKVISEDYGVVQAETNPSKTKKQQFLDLIKPQIQAQTYKENVGKGANQMFHFGKMWSRVTIKAKPIKINSFAPTGVRDRLIDLGQNAKGNTIGASEYTYAYHELDQNGNPLPPMSALQPIIDDIENALGIDMSDYDSVIGNIYQPNEFIFPHKDVTESKSAEGYPVIVYTMGANAGLGIVDNNKGKMTFANQYDDRYLRGDEKLKGYTNEVLTKDGSIYTFGLNGNGRFQLTHSTPINDAKVGSQLPITLPNGKVISNYTITLTFRRAADLTPGIPLKPSRNVNKTVAGGSNVMLSEFYNGLTEAQKKILGNLEDLMDEFENMPFDYSEEEYIESLKCKLS
jgi:hypothetical protein